MKKFVVIIICAAVAVALGAAGVIIFMPKGESIHFDREFIKRENGLVAEEGSTPYGTSENISMNVSLTADKDNLYKADGNLKIGNRTINITSATKVEFGYFLEENNSENSVDVIFDTNGDDKINVIIREGDYMGVWYTKEFVPEYLKESSAE
ncbi:MAG: hypothetical protein KH377_10075 [[Eubacterium] siraeum]|nr:hypothetical protein [[Eubacterium] siraeum]